MEQRSLNKWCVILQMSVHLYHSWINDRILFSLQKSENQNLALENQDSLTTGICMNKCWWWKLIMANCLFVYIEKYLQINQYFETTTFFRTTFKKKKKQHKNYVQIKQKLLIYMEWFFTFLFLPPCVLNKCYRFTLIYLPWLIKPRSSYHLKLQSFFHVSA